MKIAIHHNKGSFSDRWISYCRTNNIPFKLVDAYENNIVEQLNDCKIFLWHFHHANYADSLFAKQLLYSLELSGKIVFPNYKTVWSFDDKIAQYYILKAIGAPIVNTYIFYTQEKSLEWIKNSTFPKVFKLRSGAGSSNVKLIKTRRQALKMIYKIFKSGYNPYNSKEALHEGWRKFKDGKLSLKGFMYKFYRYCIPQRKSKLFPNEKGYFYAQDFIPNNNFDVRIIVIGEKAFGIKRMNRTNDFRASGSGSVVYSKDQIDERCVQIAFRTNEYLQSQCVAFDFIFENNAPRIVELSFGFTYSAYEKCEGFWDKKLNWYKGTFDPYGWIIENLKIKN